jgi:hypothetical protein
LDRIKTCRSCELRYACYDCRILEEILEGEIKGKENSMRPPLLESLTDISSSALFRFLCICPNGLE